MELGSNGNYMRGAGETAHIFGDLGSTAKKLSKNNFRDLGRQSIIFRN